MPLSPDLDRLERLAKDAPGSNWSCNQFGAISTQINMPEVDPEVPQWLTVANPLPRELLERHPEAHGRLKAAHEFIAAADPQTVLALVAELRAAREVREVVEAIRRLLERSPIGPTRGQAVSTLFEIRLLVANHDEVIGGGS